MAKFAATYPGNEFVQQPVAQIPWGHKEECTEQIAPCAYQVVALM